MAVGGVCSSSGVSAMGEVRVLDYFDLPPQEGDTRETRVYFLGFTDSLGREIVVRVSLNAGEIQGVRAKPRVSPDDFMRVCREAFPFLMRVAG